jgi:hypothetical protein
MTNSIPLMLNVLREATLPQIAEWCDLSVGGVRHWQQNKTQPQVKARADLIAHVRCHAKQLLALAEQVEREGTHNTEEN